MQLDDFVFETIQRIVNGIKRAKETCGPDGADVNPEQIRGVPSSDIANRALLKPQKIEFDVAVTTSEGSTEKGGLGIFVGPIAVGAQGRAESANQSVSRIKFSVPILYP